LYQGPVAQLVEQGTFNPKVAGSRPARPTSNGRLGSREHVTLFANRAQARLYDPRMIHLRMVAPPARLFLDLFPYRRAATYWLALTFQ
jgi:hypothetical protein